jgi:signal transduction histidine kinase
MRGLRLLLWPAGAALGIVAEWALYGWAAPRDWVPDLLTGWTLIACGLIGWSRRPESRSGPLMATTGFIWFAGNFTTSGFGALEWLSAHALFLYRGPLVHLVLTYPRGRSVGRLERAAVAAGYAAAVVLPIWRSEIATIVLAGVLVAVAGRGYFGAVGRERRERLYALQATAFLGVVLAGARAGLPPLAFPTTGLNATPIGYQAALCALAIGLLAGLIRVPWERPAVTDLVVELGETRSGTLRYAMAGALGDPTLEVGYWLPDRRLYVDPSGRVLDLPPVGSDRRVTRLERDGQELAVLVHDAAVLNDPALIEAVAAAAELGASNTRLQAEVRARVEELGASRRRLIEASDDERRRLEQRLSEGAARRLASLAQLLAAARTRAGPETARSIGRAESQLTHTLAELRELGAGLHPRELAEHGLAEALRSLAEQSPVRVDLEVSSERLPKDVEAAAFFVCSEALANVVKYASASRAVVSASVSRGTLRVEVVDDGDGGADPAAGTGLRGLADRVEAVGGTLSVESPPGEGTHLTADLPLAAQPDGSWATRAI